MSQDNTDSDNEFADDIIDNDQHDAREPNTHIQLSYNVQHEFDRRREDITHSNKHHKKNKKVETKLRPKVSNILNECGNVCRICLGDENT